MTQLLRLKVKLLGTQHCSRDGPVPVPGGNGSPRALGTRDRQPHFIARETEAWGYRGMLASLWAHPPPCQQPGVSGLPSHMPCPQQGPQVPPAKVWISQWRLLFSLKDSDDSFFKFGVFF